MLPPLVISGCQIPVTLDILKNLKEIKRAIDWAAENKVDILATPECALSGYLWKPLDNNDERVTQLLTAFTEVLSYSADKKVDLLLGTAWYNAADQWSDTMQFIVDGKVEHIHYKNVLFEHQYTPGDGVKVLHYRGKRIGTLLCSDIWGNPIKNLDVSAGLVRSLIDQQCDILFVSANTPKGLHNLFLEWHNSCVRMYTHLGKWITVVSDNTYKMEGFEWEGRTGVDCGIYLTECDFLKAREHGTDYFKMVVYERIYR